MDVFYIKGHQLEIKGLSGLMHVRDSLYLDGVIDGGDKGSFSNLRTVGKSMDVRLDYDSKNSFQWLSKLETCPSITLDYYYLYPYDLCGLKPFIIKNPDTKYIFKSITRQNFDENLVLSSCP